MAVYLTLYEHFGWLNWWPADSDFEVCVGAILTQNTAWTNVEKAINNLKANGMMSPQAILSASKIDIANLIKSSGYFNQKARYLKDFCSFLSKNSFTELKRIDLKKARDLLLGVKGVGKETADSILLYALDRPVFVIAAYTKRVLSRMGFIKENIGYDELQSFFHKRLLGDLDLFKDYHAQIVMIAKTYCKKVPMCVTCPLRKANLCCFCNKSL